MEEVRVVGHVEHGAEPDTPRIVLGLVVPGFTDEHRHAPVDRLGQLGIATGAKGRAGPGVGVQQRDVFRRQREAALRVAQLVDGMGEEHVLGVVGGGLCAAAGSDQAELVAAVHPGEENTLVLEVEQANQRLRPHNVLKEELGRIVGRDAGRQHAADTASVVHHVPHPLGEDRVGVDVASCTQGIAPGIAHQVAPPLGLSQRVEERPVELGSWSARARIIHLRAAALGAFAISGLRSANHSFS